MKSMRLWLFFVLIALLAVPSVNAAVQVVASNTVQYSNTSVTASSPSVQWYNTTLDSNVSGTVNLSVQLKVFNPYTDVCSGMFAYYQFYADGVALGTEQSTSSTIFVWLNQSGVVVSNLKNLSLKVWASGTGSDDDFCESPPPAATNAEAENFMLMYDHRFPPNPESDINYTFSNYTTHSLGASYIGSVVTAYIIPRVNKLSPYDINTSGLIGWWKFDDNLNDSSGQNNNGTAYSLAHAVSSASYVSGRYNNASSYNYDKYTEILNDPLYNLTSSVSGFVTIHLNSFNATTQQTIFTKRKGTTGSIGLRLANGVSDDELEFFYKTGAQWHIFTTNNANLTITNNYTIGFSYIFGTPSSLILAKNGNSLSGTWTTGDGTGIPTLNSFNLTVGARDDGLESFDGWIDNLYLYNVTKTFGEINNNTFVKPVLRVKSDSGTGDWSDYWYNYTEYTGGDSPINITSGGTFSNILIDFPTSYTQDGVYMNEFQKLAIFNITADITSSEVYFVSPTKSGASEAWNQNNTTIAIQATKNISSINLSWTERPDLPVGYTRNSANTTYYSMTEINLTNFIINFSNLQDGFYSYSANVSFVDGNYSTLSSWTRINLTLPSGELNVVAFLQQFASTAQYVTSMSRDSFNDVNQGNATLIEPEYTLFLSTSSPFVPLYRCYNPTTWLYRDSTSCWVNETTSIILGGILPVATYNINTIALNRYYNAANSQTVSFAGRANIPAGFVFQEQIGWVKGMIGHQEDIVYINNSKLKIGIDTKYGGVIVFASTNISASFLDNDNLINNYDAGRQIQNDYTNNSAAFQGIYEGVAMYLQDWNPLIGGSKYNEPSLAINNIINTSNSFYADIDAINFNPDWGNTKDPKMRLITTYTFDGENAGLIANYTYIYSDIYDRASAHNATNNFENNPGIFLRNDLSNISYYNLTTAILTNVSLSLYECGTRNNGLYASAVNSTGIGVGVWNWGSPRFGFCNANNSANISPFLSDSIFMAAQPAFGVMKNGTIGSTKSNFVRMFFGNNTEIQSYFTGLAFSINFDPSVQINQTVENQNYLNIRVNTSDVSPIRNATLFWTNVSGKYPIQMNVYNTSLFAFMNMSGLSNYNYSYYVSSNSTTGVISITDAVWTNILDTLPPASVTSVNMVIGNFFINNSWIYPSDVDFNHTVFRYANGTILQNISASINYLNLTYSPHYTQNISAQTVDTSGNINETKVWFNATIPNNLPTVSNYTNAPCWLSDACRVVVS